MRRGIDLTQGFGPTFQGFWIEGRGHSGGRRGAPRPLLPGQARAHRQGADRGRTPRHRHRSHLDPNRARRF
eukprot:scaffold519_cov331-Pavlova_lutheri.AAC.27